VDPQDSNLQPGRYDSASLILGLSGTVPSGPRYLLELADQFGPAFMRSAWKPAIRLSRKDWHFGALGEVAGE
jgi:hypothetical protein